MMLPQALRLLPILTLALGVPLVGCAAQEDEGTEAGEDAVRRSSVDLKAYSFVTVVIATDDAAGAFKKVLDRAGAPTIERGKTTLVGYTTRELEGGAHDPAANGDDAYGITCGKDGIGMMTCAFTGVTRTSEVETRGSGEDRVVTKVTLSGKLGSALASRLPATTERVGGREAGYAPLRIACESTSGHTGNVPVAKCSIPTTGFGVTMSIQQMVDEGAMSAADARKFVKSFFPEG